jgi:hypothetical protein
MILLLYQIHMLYKKTIAILIALSTVAGITIGARHNNAAHTMKWIVLKGSTVKVNGSTNINKFVCTVADYASSDTITCFPGKTNKNAIAMTGQMEVPVLNFDCANKFMTKDLLKTLQQKDHPNLCINFISMERYPLLQTAPEAINGWVNIELAGVKKELAINYNISMDDQGIIDMTGMQSICFSDFGLQAPRKMGGMVRASNTIEVKFSIHCRRITP